MMPEENPATDGGGDDGGDSPPEGGPQMGQGEQGTDAPDETEMDLDQQDGLGNELRTGTVQEPPVGLPPLARRRQFEIVSTMAQISLLAQALGGFPADRRDPQTGQGQQQERQAAPQEEDAGQASPAGPTPQEDVGQRSDSQDFIPLTFAQTQGGQDERELGELPLSREQMRQAGSLLQARVAQEQHQQANAPPRKHAAITVELSTERQARQMAERRIAELEAQMASIRTPAQRLVPQHSVGGQQTAQMLPRPLQMGARTLRPVLGGVPQMAPPTYSQVAQRPPIQATLRPAAPLQAAPRSVREMQRR